MKIKIVRLLFFYGDSRSAEEYILKYTFMAQIGMRFTVNTKL
jgi:hypothetical protein